MTAGLRRAIGAFTRNRDGNVLIISALSMPVLIGMAALVAEYGGALLERVDNQRVADLSSYAGALAYGGTKSTTQMENAAKNVAALNGIAASKVTVTLGTSPKTPANKAVVVRIETQKPLFLSKVLSTRANLSIVAQAQAEVSSDPGTPGCVLALSPTQTGITLSGGTKIYADKCSVSSNNTVTVPCGTTIRTVGLNYNSAAAPTVGCSGIVSPNATPVTIAKQATVDPLAGNAAIAAATAHINSVAALSAPTAPAAPTNTTGTSIVFDYSKSAETTATAMGCTATRPTSSSWTFTCPTNKAIVDLGNVTIAGGISLTFTGNGLASTVYNIAGDFTSAATTTFGPGIYNFAKSVTTAGTTTFGNGTYNIGKLLKTAGTTHFGTGNFNLAKGLQTTGTTNFGAGTFKIGATEADCTWDSGRVSICNTGTLTFAGPSTFELSAGFMNGGGATINFGSGSSNSFKIGPSSKGNAVKLGGGAVTIMADATGASSVFQIVGNVDGSGGGGSCFVVGAAAQHDIAGNFSASGAVVLGAGVYTVDGYLSLGADGGGSATCNGETVSVKAIDVTLVLSGKATSNVGTCNGLVFCVAAGYSNVRFSAPSSGPYAKLAVVGPQLTSRTGGATFAGGSSDAQISGAFYFPNGPITMGGGSSALGSTTDPTKCLQLIGSRITLSGGTAVASECIAATGSTGGTTKVTLVQ